MKDRTKKKTERNPTDAVRKAILNTIRKAGSSGVNASQLAMKLGLKDKGQRAVMRGMIDKLLHSGKIKPNKKGRYVLSDAKGTVAEGTMDVISNGSGFVTLDGETGKDVMIRRDDMGVALHGDRVKIKVKKGGGSRRQGKVLQVVERRRNQFVGNVHKQDGRLIVVPDDKRMNRPLLVTGKETKGAKEGDKVVVDLIKWDSPYEPPRVSVNKVLGKAGEHKVEMHAIMEEYGLPLEFPQAVIDAAEKINGRITPEEIAKRRDMRGVITLTIDPDDAKDLDDAISLKKLQNGNWEVGIHIADVSHYVTAGSIVDKEASDRATSVYLVDRVVPMLPERLSNDLCSLNSGTDKLCYSAILELDENAEVKGQWFGRTIIHSDRRFAYEEAQRLIEGETGDFSNEVQQLHALAQHLRKARIQEGSLEIISTEMKFRLDEDGRPIGVYEKVMREANWLVEEFMLLANRSVAAYIGKPKKGQQAPPYVYRIHDLPDDEKIQNLRKLVKNFGFNMEIKKGEPISAALNRLLTEIKDKEEAPIIRMHLIRSMSKAIYSTDNIGHYGLGFEYYTHFTSPIRRYPDVMVHRGLAHYMSGGKPLDKEALDAKCKHSSDQERQAAMAERSSVAYKQAEYLKARLNQQFTGVIGSLTTWGMYVTLNENHCEGMVSLRDIPGDHYEFDADKFVVRGNRKGKIFRIGQEVEVIVHAVDMDRREVDLVLV